MPVKYSDLEDAFQYVSSDMEGINHALLNKETGEHYWSSEYDPDFSDWPEDAEDPDKYVTVPHKHELDLGRELVRDFAARHCADQWDTIERIFSRKGAYRRFKDWLDQRNMLQSWYNFENQRTKEALLSWCQLEGIEVIDDEISQHAAEEHPSD